MKFLFGYPAYYYLNNTEHECVFSKYSEKALDQGAVLRYMGYYNRKETNQYIFLDTHLAILDLSAKIPIQQRNFFEVRGKNVKPYFDIDIDIEEFKQHGTQSTLEEEFKYTLAYLVQAMREVLALFDIIIQHDQVVLCTSHNENKMSGHVTLPGYACWDNVEAKAFYQLVKDKMPAHKRWVDHAVYNPNQNWRLLGHQKVGSGRIKTLQRTWAYLDDEGEWKIATYTRDLKSGSHPLVTQLEDTMLRSFGGRVLPSFVEQAGERDPSIVRQSMNALHFDEPGDEDTLEKVKALIQEKMGFQSFPFIVLTNYKHMITLKLRFAYDCPTCSVKHQNENPYVFMDGKRAWFNCRRSAAHSRDGRSKSYLLGDLQLDIEDDQDEDLDDEDDEDDDDESEESDEDDDDESEESDEDDDEDEESEESDEDDEDDEDESGESSESEEDEGDEDSNEDDVGEVQVEKVPEIVVYDKKYQDLDFFPVEKDTTMNKRFAGLTLP